MSMFRNEKLVKPTNWQIAAAIVVGIASFVGNYFSPAIGLVLALFTMVLIGAQWWIGFRVWPVFKYKVHPLVFGLYWGLIIGLVIPMLITVLLEYGIGGIWELLVS